MSQDHVDAMNDLRAGSEEVLAAARELSRDDVLAYELTDGPDDGAIVYWQLRLGPDGLAFALVPAPAADVWLRGDWRVALTAFACTKNGEQADDGLTADGDLESFMTAVGPQFALGRKVATIPATFPA
ncbi:hypothetical protein [Sciscionella sediminilitoris]|uniref:hypothetical protein n=1 Tax=Sciscionella sediminilitoris TaxID=1445613 RepID=UPI001E37F4E5|nr:hypothetical protein [Sciscionella sp. SE31]